MKIRIWVKFIEYYTVQIFEYVYHSECIYLKFTTLIFHFGLKIILRWIRQSLGLYNPANLSMGKGFLSEVNTPPNLSGGVFPTIVVRWQLPGAGVTRHIAATLYFEWNFPICGLNFHFVFFWTLNNDERSNFFPLTNREPIVMTRF